MKVIIESIERQYVMSADSYLWIKEHLGEELQVSSIDFNVQHGGIFCLVVALEGCVDPIACIFESNHATFRFIGSEELQCIDTI